MSSVRYGRRKKRLMAEINVVPYIDVMLVLLVIFMVTAPLLSTGVAVDLPGADAQPLEEDQEPFVVTVDKQGLTYLNDHEEPVSSVEEIQRQAAITLKKNPRTPFMVRGDGAVAYAEVVSAMVMLQQAGVEKVGLATDAMEQ
ncbi:MAG: protein TolR [Proteobacteria bacterium]|nr:protein TolR [Pseudomonadota bacterium]